MRVVERQNDDLASQSPEKHVRALPSDQIGPIEPRKTNPGYVPAYRSITRRPPELRLNVNEVLEQSELERLISHQIEEIAGTETLDFAFSVSELASRLEGVMSTANDPEVLKGFETLARTAKMYEHLIVLQNEGPE
ncbi:hypothetical protein [Yoonia sp. 2307UL14-13]|uniref:hypothetical protein n=1 Tax=Yoonia sp. 2307UL14-13 TaxID=3126506 RepID=UPI0030ACA81E